MKKWVSTNEKRKFIKWFLDNHRLKRTEAHTILEFLLKHNHILDNVHFTEEIIPNENVIILSSTTSDEVGFQFYTRNGKSDDIAQALGELMSNPTGKYHLLIHFYGKLSNHRYLNLIDIPALEKIRQYHLSEKYALQVDELLEINLVTNKIERLKIQIDNALDQKDENLFKELVAELKRYEQGKQTG